MPTCPKCSTPFAAIPGQPIVCPGCGQKFRAAKSESADDRLPPAAPPVASANRPTVTVAVPLPADPPPFVSQPETVPSHEPLTGIDIQAKRTVSTWRPRFEPRQYPAMRIIVALLYAFAALNALGFILTTAFVIFALISNSNAVQSENGFMGPGNLLGSAVILIASLFVYGVPILLFTALAESIRIWLDIQENTQETAFLARLRQWA